MQKSIDIFRDCMKRAEDLHDLHANLSVGPSGESVRADILRAEIVMTVSAFDLFNHELIRLGMLECFDDIREKTEKYDVFTSEVGFTSDMSRGEFSDEIRKKHKRMSFQGHKSVAKGIRFFHEFRKDEGGLWKSVANRLNTSTEDTKTQLNLIIDRRNAIVHGADIRPRSKKPWPIKREYVEASCEHVKNVAETIYGIVTE